MPLIWAAISAHGYGHAAQVVPVLNALGTVIPNLRVLLRTTVPAAFFKERLRVPWEHSPVQQDIGCIQDGPLSIDVEATWREHQEFHADWTERLSTEQAAMQRARPNVVLADTPYLALAAGHAVSIPAVALVSFTWDVILSEFTAPDDVPRDSLLTSIRASYAQTDLAMKITPAPAMEHFRRLVEIAPIAEPASPARDELSRVLALAPGERTVLVGFGGIQLRSLPFAHLERLAGYRFLFDGPIPSGSRRFVSTQALPFSFKTLMASVDVIMSKPGYATLVEAVALGIPLIYVRRYNFADEQPLVDYLHRYGRGVELSRDDFAQGRWETVLSRACSLPAPTVPPSPTGAAEAAAQLASYFS